MVKKDTPTPETIKESKDVLTTKSAQPELEVSSEDSEILSETTDVHEDETVVVNKKPGKFRLKPWQWIVLGVVVVLLLVGSIAGVFAYQTYQVAQQLQLQAAELQVEARPTLDLVKQQNLPAIQERLKEHRADLESMEATMEQLSWYQSVPVAKNYYSDAQHAFDAGYAGLDAADKAVAALLPYGDLLGFGETPEDGGGTAEDRVAVLLASLEKLNPELDAIEADLQRVSDALAQIDPQRYPEEVDGKPLRSYVIQAQDLSAGAAAALADYRPVIDQLPKIAGADGERKKYLILFQNDNELRPTGGFLTAYATIYVENGKVTPEKSDDIYELDQKFNERIEIPEALGRYLTTERYWNLRDMNISPDFKTSMDQFYGEYKDIPGEPDDIYGIIAVDTHFLTGLLEILGPVQVPGYGTFSAEPDARCDCPQIIYALSEIITRPTPYLREDRKGILGPLMRSVLTKAYDAPKEMNADLFEMGISSVRERHVQMYFLDEEAQRAAELVNAAGTLPAEVETDFLAIVNANLGGAKSNLFVNYEVEQLIESAPENGMLTKTVEITYKNPRKGDNCNLEAGLLCLNSTLRDWTRLYIPEGSELVDAQGFTEEPTVYDEAGFTVVDGFFILEPLGTAKIVLTYKVPYTDMDTYRVKLWKQGGLGEIPVLFDVTGGQEQVQFVEDTTYSTPF